MYAAPEARGWDARSQVEAMDAEGLDLAVLYPSRGLFVLGVDSSEHIGADGLEPAFASAIARAYNNWMRDFCDESPERMFGAAMVAPHDPEGAVIEARRCVEELGFKAVFLAPATVNRRPWHHPAYDQLWAEIAPAGRAPRLPRRWPHLPHGPTSVCEVLDSLMLWHTFSQPLGIQFVDRLPVRGRCARAPPRTCASPCWRATARGRRGSCTASTSTGSGRAGTRRPSSRCRRRSTSGATAGSPSRPTRRRCRRSSTRSATSASSSPPTTPTGTRSSRTPSAAFDELPMTEETKAKVVGQNWTELYRIPLVKHT